MKFLKNVEVGEQIWIKTCDSYGLISYSKDLVLRILKTKIVTKGDEFYTKDGESLNNNDKIHNTIVEYTDEIKEFMLNVRYLNLSDNLARIEFDNNEKFENFIIKLENLYNANKGIKKRDI